MFNNSQFTTTAVGSPTNTPPRRKRGAVVSLGRRNAMEVEMDLAIPPGNSRVPKSIMGPLTGELVTSTRRGRGLDCWRGC